jgi:predicted transcriptional regulator
MVDRKKQRNENALTEVELELMTIIWELGECTVKQVQSALPPSRDLAYTSVATMMKILEQKKVLKSRKQEKAHTYTPVLSKADYEATALRNIAHSLFQGNSTSMVMRLLDESDLTENELKSIRAFLDERLSHE